MSPAKRKLVPRNRAEATAAGLPLPPRRAKGEGALFFTSRGCWEARVELPKDPITGKRRTKVIRDKEKGEAQRKLNELRLELVQHGSAGACGRAQAFGELLVLVAAHCPFFD